MWRHDRSGVVPNKSLPWRARAASPSSKVARTQSRHKYRNVRCMYACTPIARALILRRPTLSRCKHDCRQGGSTQPSRRTRSLHSGSSETQSTRSQTRHSIAADSEGSPSLAFLEPVATDSAIAASISAVGNGPKVWPGQSVGLAGQAAGGARAVFCGASPRSVTAPSCSSGSSAPDLPSRTKVSEILPGKGHGEAGCS